MQHFTHIAYCYETKWGLLKKKTLKNKIRRHCTDIFEQLWTSVQRGCHKLLHQRHPRRVLRQTRDRPHLHIIIIIIIIINVTTLLTSTVRQQKLDKRVSKTHIYHTGVVKNYTMCQKILDSHKSLSTPTLQCRCLSVTVVNCKTASAIICQIEHFLCMMIRAVARSGLGGFKPHKHNSSPPP